MTPTEIHAIIEQSIFAWTHGEADVFATLFTDDGEFIVPGKHWVGPAAIRKALADFADSASDISIHLSQVIVAVPSPPEGDRVLLEWHWENVDLNTGKRVVADDAIAIDFRGARISRWREYIDSVSPSTSS